jgi:phosphate/sulfate permease
MASGIIKTVAFIFVSPLLGYVLGSLMMVLVAWICRRNKSPLRVDNGSAACSWCRRACTAWATAATTRRRPSASSGCC